jgi:serine/threonine-protein kinase
MEESMSPRPRIGGYEVLGRIARGSTGDVFLATPWLAGDDTPAAVVLGLVAAGRRVGLKRLYPHLALDEDFLRMFVDEVQLMSRFRHEHIVGVHDLDEDGETCFAVLELVDGPSLSAALRVRARQRGVAQTGLPVEAAVAIAAAVADALVAVHALRDATSGEPLELVHRDVNPQNVLVGQDGAVKLADFGVARSVVGRRSGVLKTKETTAGTRKGKASYLAPEQILGRHPLDASRPIDQRADLYALGATLWCLLCGAPPFVAPTEIALFDAVLQAPTPRLKDVGDVVGDVADDAVLDALLASLLARDPDARPADAVAVRAALQAWLGARGVDITTAVADAVMDLGLPSLRTA